MPCDAMNLDEPSCPQKTSLPSSPWPGGTSCCCVLPMHISTWTLPGQAAQGDALHGACSSYHHSRKLAWRQAATVPACTAPLLSSLCSAGRRSVRHAIAHASAPCRCRRRRRRRFCAAGAGAELSRPVTVEPAARRVVGFSPFSFSGQRVRETQVVK